MQVPGFTEHQVTVKFQFLKAALVHNFRFLTCLKLSLLYDNTVDSRLSELYLPNHSIFSSIEDILLYLSVI